LARAILSHLLQRGITTIATTHHSELKVFAHSTPGIQNASVEFDPETLAPTYRLSLGLPGRSNAIAIAARLGLSTEIVVEARSMLSPSQMEADSLLADIQRERDKAMTERRSAEERGAKLEQEEGLLSQRLLNIEEEKREIIETTRQEVEAEAAELLKRLRRVAASIEDKEQLAEELRAIRAELDRGPWRPKEPPSPNLESGAPTLQPGDVVWIRGLNQRGVILSSPDSEGEAEVQVGALKAKVRLDQIEVREGMGAGERMASVSLPALRREALPGLELHLRGKRVEEVLPELDRYLNDAFLAGFEEVRIVHGKGMGILRQVVREQLTNHPLVKSFRTAERDQGGEGVTVAELAQ
jgi:DNA mismatch repair protein MutS2